MTFTYNDFVIFFLFPFSELSSCVLLSFIVHIVTWLLSFHAVYCFTRKELYFLCTTGANTIIKLLFSQFRDIREDLS